jgi:hypothetical protein
VAVLEQVDEELGDGIARVADWRRLIVPASRYRLTAIDRTTDTQTTEFVPPVAEFRYTYWSGDPWAGQLRRGRTVGGLVVVIITCWDVVAGSYCLPREVRAVGRPPSRPAGLVGFAADLSELCS